MISIHAPLAGCDLFFLYRAKVSAISIHAPLAGCDPCTWWQAARTTYFNPRTPCGVRPECALIENLYLGISIHAPLAGCDYTSPLACRSHPHFNPRTPCGVRPADVTARDEQIAFQSTHPLRGATWRLRTWQRLQKFQSTHPLRGATSAAAASPLRARFQSTHPLRGATRYRQVFRQHEQISIHAPLAGCDSKNVQRKLHFFELADKLSARIAAKKPSAKADRCA